MDTRNTVSMTLHKLRNACNQNTLRNFFSKVSRRKRLLGVGLGFLLLFILLMGLFSQSETAQEANKPNDVVKEVPKQEPPGPPVVVVTVPPFLSVERQKTSKERIHALGYRKSSDFFRSIVRGNSHAMCIGSNETRGEVEDLLCMPRPDFDPRMKNPCWWENITQTPAPWMRSPSKTVSSLSCLPYFHILCCSKAGTTDLYRRISLHPDIVPNFGQFGKERLWWSWLKYGYRNRHDKGDPLPFYKYVKGFSILARYLEKASAQDSKILRRLITLDGSPADMWDLRGWTQLPQNRNLRQPAVTTPHLMRHLYRNPKFIVMARDPAERLYTAYLFHGLGRSSEEFHRDVVKGIAIFDQCLEKAEDRIECFVNDSVFAELTVDLHYSCYVVYYEEWLKVFPRKNFLFLRTEDYSADVKGTLQTVFKFLNLPRPSANEMQKMVDAPLSFHTKQRDLAGPMLEETRALLKAWFQPWNLELARLMKNKAYLWNDVNPKS